VKRKIHQKCGIIKSLPEEHYCGEPIIGMSTGGVLVCEEHARMLTGRNIKVTFMGIENHAPGPRSPPRPWQKEVG
jgi:hypothetical protein